MKLNAVTKWILPIGLTNILMVNIVFAWGIYIPLSSVSDLGQEFSGGAAYAEDASTNYKNSAGLTRFKVPQLVLGAAPVSTRFNFSGTMTNPGLGYPAIETGKASTTLSGVIPSFHYVHPLSDKLALGFSFLVSYGLSLSYPSHDMVRYEVIHAKQASIDLSPSIAYRMTPCFSVGLGLDLIDYELKQKFAVRTQALTSQDSIVRLKGDSWNLGWHGGLLYEITPDTRVGLAYHSKFTTNNKGSSHFHLGSTVFNPQPSVSSSNNTRVVVPLSSITTLSAYHKFNARWAIMGTLEFMGWGTYKYNRVYNLASPIGAMNSITPRKLRNALLYALGTNYIVNDRWLLRGGVSFLSGSSDTKYRDIYIIDPDALNFAIGAHYQPNCHLGWDFAYGKPFFKTVRLDHTAGNIHLVGRSSERSLGTLAAQLVWNFI